MLQREFEKAGIKYSADGRAVVDAKKIYHTKEPRNLEAACRFYLSEEHTHAHPALDDVLATWRVINAQVNRCRDLPHDPAGINAMFNKPVDPWPTNTAKETSHYPKMAGSRYLEGRER
jgi:DNA polymerase-3 subunit epsilon